MEEAISISTKTELIRCVAEEKLTAERISDVMIAAGDAPGGNEAD